MKTTILFTAVAALGILTTLGAHADTPKKHHTPLRHKTSRQPATRHHPQYVLRRTPSQGTGIVDTHPLPRPSQVPATPAPQTPGATPATPPVEPGASGDTRTPMTPPGVGGTGVPGGPGTQP